MNGIHPKSARAVRFACAALLLVAGGCKSTSSSATTPFLAPDRVSPPSTRMIAPGQAQPYYQGDPLPVMQSAAQPAGIPVAANSAAANTLSSTGRTLTWGAGSNTPPAATPVAIPVTQASNPGRSPWEPAPAPKVVSYGNEAPVAVPNDNDSLRYALPAPISPAPVQTISPAAAAQSSAPQPASMAANNGVALASYNSPVTNAVAVPNAAAQTVAVSPWRAPQAGQAPVTPSYVPVAPVSSNLIAVQLRSVASPPPQPGDPMPRVRIPGYEVQTAALDGFRPRSSMR